MKIGNAGTTGFFSGFGSGSEQKPRKPTLQNKLSTTPESPLGDSDQAPRVVLSTTSLIHNLVLPPASYVAELYKQNQE